MLPCFLLLIELYLFTVNLVVANAKMISLADIWLSDLQFDVSQSHYV